MGPWKFDSGQVVVVLEMFGWNLLGSVGMTYGT